MRSNHLPDGVWMGMGQPSVNTGTGYGLGVRPGRPGQARQSRIERGVRVVGRCGHAFHHRSEKDIVAIFLTQKFPDDRIYYNDFITMVYQALMD